MRIGSWRCPPSGQQADQQQGLVAVRAALVTEGYVALAEGADALVGDGAPVDVPGEIADQL